MAKGPMILVCGLPSSGNRLVSEHFMRAGCFAPVHHGQPLSALLDGIENAQHIVCPERSSVEAWVLANVRHKRFWVFGEGFLAKRHSALRDCGRTVHRICLEEIGKTGGRALDEVMERMGIDPPKWPEPVRNGDATKGGVQLALCNPKRYRLRVEEA